MTDVQTKERIARLRGDDGSVLATLAVDSVVLGQHRRLVSSRQRCADLLLRLAFRLDPERFVWPEGRGTLAGP